MTASPAEEPGERLPSKPSARGFAIALGAMIALAVGLGVGERKAVNDAAEASSRLTAVRIHIEKVTSLRRDTRKAHVALLESWLAPVEKRHDGVDALAKMLASVSAQHESFQALSATEPAEEPIRGRLGEAHRAWAALMASTVLGLPGELRGPERLADHQAALARFDREADAVLGLCSRTGETVDARVVTLQERQKALAQMFIAAVLGCIGLGLVWRTRQIADDRVREAARNEEARAAKMRSQFFASMSHELRTPLVSITNVTTSFAEDGTTPEARKQIAAHIESEARDLLGIINNILDFAKLESEHAQLLIEDVALADVLKRSEKRCQPLLQGKEVELRVELEDDAVLVRADFVKLQQVFTNLVANAIKFTEKGSVVVRAGAARGGTVVVEVEDTGIGIEGPAVDTLFHAFRQADSRTAATYGGTGLGLAIVKGVLDRLGGTVEVRSAPGEGTRFTVTLPAASAAA